jgi:hypothetical protein
VQRHAENAKSFGVDYRTVRLPVTTLARVCERAGGHPIDFLKIDVEGAEADVLFGGDWQRIRPKVVVVEAVTPGSGDPAWQEWEPFLIAQNYRFVLFDTLNRFYVADEHPEIMARLPSDRAPWDAVRHMYEIGRAPENAQHPDHGLAQQLARGFWASLPYLETDLIASLLRRGRRNAVEPDAIAATVDSEAFRAALGRIACGYDGGQIIEQ